MVNDKGSISHGSASLPILPPALEKPQPQPTVQVAIPTECPWFRGKLNQLPALRKWEAQLRQDGYNTKETISYLQVDDMAAMGIPIGIRRLLDDLKKQAANENPEASSSNQ